MGGVLWQIVQSGGATGLGESCRAEPGWDNFVAAVLQPYAQATALSQRKSKEIQNSLSPSSSPVFSPRDSIATEEEGDDLAALDGGDSDSVSGLGPNAGSLTPRGGGRH